jgi:hypothetical protein
MGMFGADCHASTILTLLRFGAVLEDFELQDSLENIFAQKDALPALATTQLNDGMSTQQVAAY